MQSALFIGGTRRCCPLAPSISTKVVNVNPMISRGLVGGSVSTARNADSRSTLQPSTVCFGAGLEAPEADKEACVGIEGLGGSDIDKLNEQYGIQGFIRFEAGENGLAKAVLTHPNGSTLEVYLHGATVTRWRRSNGLEAVYRLPGATMGKGAGIQGGISPSFPQYNRAFVGGLEDIPAHGFARSMEWEVVGTEITVSGSGEAEWEEDGSFSEPLDPAPRIAFRLRDTEETRKTYPHKFEVFVEFCLGENDDEPLEDEGGFARVVDPVFREEFVAIKEKERLEKEALEAEKSKAVRTGFDRGFYKGPVEPVAEPVVADTTPSLPEETMIKTDEETDRQAEQVQAVIRVFNRGETTMPFTAGFFTHLNVLDAGAKFTQSLGFKGQRYIDAADPVQPLLGVDGADYIRFDAGAVDRTYSEVPQDSECMLCPGDRTHFRVISKGGFRDVHVYNPYTAKPNQWRDFVVMSACRGVVPVKLKAGGSWEGETAVRHYNRVWTAPIDRDMLQQSDPFPNRKEDSEVAM